MTSNLFYSIEHVVHCNTTTGTTSTLKMAIVWWWNKKGRTNPTPYKLVDSVGRSRNERIHYLLVLAHGTIGSSTNHRAHTRARTHAIPYRKTHPITRPNMVNKPLAISHKAFNWPTKKKKIKLERSPFFFFFSRAHSPALWQRLIYISTVPR